MKEQVASAGPEFFQQVKDRTLRDPAYEPSYVGGELDRKNLRMYEWQRGEFGENRETRARAAVERVMQASRSDDADAPALKYTLLWVRDNRDKAAFMDTKPEILKQSIEVLRATDPDRKIFFIGDDPAAWQARRRMGEQRPTAGTKRATSSPRPRPPPRPPQKPGRTTRPAAWPP
ncbi:hypothetical protein ACIPW5_37800 [Streptomyces sp. NPDC090077]|uniref:hypothetical protein n=1 Tax=Streptomyces sp. NPDC090077 TaxID=3365938 RepID=UPI00380A0256